MGVPGIETGLTMAPSPESTLKGGTVSFSDEAEQLRVIAASRDFPVAMIQEARASFDNMFEEVQNVLGSQSQHTQTVGGAIEAAKTALDHAMEAAKNVEKTIHDAADGHARG